MIEIDSPEDLMHVQTLFLKLKTMAKEYYDEHGVLDRFSLLHPNVVIAFMADYLTLVSRMKQLSRSDEEQVLQDMMQAVRNYTSAFKEGKKEIEH